MNICYFKEVNELSLESRDLINYHHDQNIYSPNLTPYILTHFFFVVTGYMRFRRLNWRWRLMAKKLTYYELKWRLDDRKSLRSGFPTMKMGIVSWLRFFLFFSSFLTHKTKKEKLIKKIQSMNMMFFNEIWYNFNKFVTLLLNSYVNNKK